MHDELKKFFPSERLIVIEEISAEPKIASQEVNFVSFSLNLVVIKCDLEKKIRRKKSMNDLFRKWFSFSDGKRPFSSGFSVS